MRSVLAVIGAVAVLAAPAGAQESKARSAGFSLEDLTGKLAMIESIADMSSWFGPKPEPIPEFAYAEKRRFDMQLNQSLSAKLPVVNVRVDSAFTRNAIPERMSQWLNAVERSGGKVRHCAVEPNDRFLGVLGTVLKLTQKVDKWLLYRPTAGYDAMIVSDHQEGRVLNAVFTERGATAGCPEGTQDIGSGDPA